MRPNPAEVARTLAAGRLAGTAHVPCRPDRARPTERVLRVRHATDPTGRVLLLARAGGTVAAALTPADGDDDAAAVLTVPDTPPLPGSPSRGQVWISGWARALSGADARAAAIEFATTNPTSDLLDVGHGFVLHALDVAEVRLAGAGGMVEIDPAEFAAAEPDPLHAEERDLLVDLAEHHGDEIGAFARRQIIDSGHPCPPGAVPSVVRLDRYGFVVLLDGQRIRLAFPRPVSDRADLARMLHPVLCRRCPRHR